MKDITVLITYSQEHQNSYINFMLSTLNHTISNKNRYKILLGVDTGVKKNPDIKKINFPFDKLIQVNTKNSDYSSFAHSLVMDEMIKHIDTKYAVICDSDIAFLQKNWDIDFINMLDEKNIFIGGESNQVTYYFPHIYMAFFNAEIISIYNATNVMFKWFYVRIIGIVHTITTYEIAKFSKIIKKIKILNKRIDISAYVFGSILIIISFTFGKLIFNEWTLYRFENFNNLKVLIYLITIEAIFYVLCSNELIYLKAINKIRIVAEINIILESVSLIIIFISLLKFQNIMIVIQIQIIKNLILLFINKIYKNKQLNLTHN